MPNPFPDIIGKIAFDPKIGRTHQHFDAAVLVRRFKTYSLGTDTTFNKTAVGGELTAAVELVPSVRLVATGFYSSGGGRYIANESAGLDRQPRRQHDPRDDLVVVDRHEIQAASKTSLYAYYSAAHADRAVTTDVDGSAIGFGVPGSTAANERIVEATAGLIHTFFRDPKIGGMQFMGQYSYRAAHAFLRTRWHAGRRVRPHDLFERAVFPAVNPLRMARRFEFVQRHGQPFQSTIVSDEVEMERRPVR